MAKLVVFLFLICTMTRISSGNTIGYRRTLSRDDAIARNKVKVTCQRYENNIPQDVQNPVWYFNSTKHDEHVCTKNATISTNSFELTLTPECEGYLQCGESNRKDLSIPLRLLSYPVVAFNPQDRNEIVGDSFAIPCGIKRSATDNFKISWSRTFTVGTNVITEPIQNASDYSLTVEEQSNFDTDYSCVAEPANHLPEIVGISRVTVLTKVKVSVYVQPKIKSLKIMEVDEGMSFSLEVEADGTSNEYSWRRNSDAIEPSPPTIRVSDISGIETIEVNVSNTNVHSQVHTDFAQAFVIAPSCTSEYTGSCSMSTTIMPTTNCVPVAEPNETVPLLDAENWIIVAVCGFFTIALVAILVFAFIVLRMHCKNKEDVIYPSLDHSHSTVSSPSTATADDDKVVVTVGNNTVTIRKSQMTNISDFFQQIDAIICNVMGKLGESGERLDEDIKEHVKSLRMIILSWEDRPPSHPPLKSVESSPSSQPIENPEDRIVVDNHIAFDDCGNVTCGDSVPSEHTASESRPPAYEDLLLCSLEEEPTTKTPTYYSPTTETTFSNDRTQYARHTSPPRNDVRKDIFSLLLPTLAEKAQRNV